MESIAVVLAFTLIVILVFLGYLFLGLALKVCFLWVPVIISFLLPSICGFAFGPIGGGLGIVLGLVSGFIAFEKWEDHPIYNKLVKRIDSCFYSE